MDTQSAYKTCWVCYHAQNPDTRKINQLRFWRTGLPSLYDSIGFGLCDLCRSNHQNGSVLLVEIAVDKEDYKWSSANRTEFGYRTGRKWLLRRDAANKLFDAQALQNPAIFLDQPKFQKITNKLQKAGVGSLLPY